MSGQEVTGLIAGLVLLWACTYGITTYLEYRTTIRLAELASEERAAYLSAIKHISEQQIERNEQFISSLQGFGDNETCHSD